MTNTHITPETAVRLKEAGYPQPEFEPGQLWHREGVIYIFGGTDSLGGKYMIQVPFGRTIWLPKEKFYAFMPSIIDLIEALRSAGISVCVTALRGESRCYVQFGRFKEPHDHTYCDNPVETLAEYWLQHCKPTTEQ